ncbi:hypothetical protein NQ318_005651 [Aromia moschata]|uniref:Mos1 transposase HTH domain-containing protein n=1 Tax=Aromia moschata TaxID=1265417 RepID=A0AAV8XY90_9CUCU|nr:hypothetical protein NQ318_005651 [Aromia moschata]
MNAPICDSNVNLKFLVTLGKTFTEAYAMLKEVCGNECLSRIRVFEWFKQFKEGRETIEDDPRTGRPSTSKTDENIEKIGKLIREDRRLSAGLTAGNAMPNTDAGNQQMPTSIL